MGLFKKKIVKKTYDREYETSYSCKHLYWRRSSRVQRHTDRKNRRNHADQISRGLRKIQRDI